VLVGTVTYGKGSVQTVHRLPNDGELVITWSRIHAPSGYSFNEVGVLPNVCTSRTDRDKAGAVDAVLETVRSGRLDTAAALAVLHASPPPVKPDARVLREACPPRGSDPKLDLQVAERILADKALIASALGPATSHELAKRP
jgi:carboxyl-terminal processing protease